MAVVVAAVTAEASAEAVAFVAAALTVAFAVAGFTVLLTAVAFAAVGSTIAASTIGSSSLVIWGTRSFTIPIHTTGIIPIAIILMAMDTAAFVAVAFAAVGDACMNLFSKAAGYTDSLVGRVQLGLARGDYYYGSIVRRGDPPVVFSQRLGNKSGTAPVVLNECNRP